MIPRFNYSFSGQQAWQSLVALFTKEPVGVPLYAHLFSKSAVYEISSARAGIAYALAALQLPPNAYIGVQPYTCSSVMVAIQKAGFKPVFIDIDETLTLNSDDLAHKLTGLKALIVTHIFGIPANVSRIKEVVGDLPVIEDCAHAFGSRYDGVQLGNFFDMAVFSFGNGKFPAFGSGGLLVVNQRRYVKTVNELMNNLNPNRWFRELLFIGRQLVLSLVYSRVGLQVLYRVFGNRLRSGSKQVDTHANYSKKLYKSVQWRLRTSRAAIQTASVQQRQNALTIIQKHPTLAFICNQDPDSACFALVCLHERRDELVDYLVWSGIGAAKHFQYASTWATAFGYQRGTCPTFDRLSKQVVTIPCHDALTQADLVHIDAVLNQYTQRLLPDEQRLVCL